MDWANGIAEEIHSQPDPHAGRVKCTQCHLTDRYQQTDAEYANQCKSCHTETYEQLYYDWCGVFSGNTFRADKLQLKLVQSNSSRADEINKRITEAQKTGFHNIQLANELWDQILSDTLVPNE